ncbi:protein FAM90A1-like [Dipodomys spectabilis]|uniref:protein FAM90A1-like n=1 Tax=Dipodomys spectabilis TaxID=105255 RepID=UPI001C540C3E|nr:protein FAM90A1-like [Dipodomys spectabilis]
MSQLAHGLPGPQHPTIRIVKAVQMKQQQRDPVQLKVPPPEEENPWVKCQNCGAFGHSSRSKRCPIKSDLGSITLMPLGLKKEKMKENQKPLNLQRPRLLDQAKRYKEQTRWLAEQQGKAVLQAVSRRHQEEEKHNWPEVTAPCAYLRPLKMVFTRLHHDMWASSFLPLPSPHSTEKISPSASKFLLLDKAEGHSSGVPHSVLHENLRLSSL